MINVFETQIHEVQYLWMTLEDLAPLLVRRWKESARNSEFHPEIRRLIGRAGQDMVNIKLAKYKGLIQTVHKELSSLVDYMVKPYVFILTAEDGFVLSMYGRDTLLTILDEENNLGIGTLFSLEHTGINAISVATELQTNVFIHGSEHELQLFSRWNCLCAPIRVNEDIVGYLDMSFSENEDHLLAGTLFEVVMRRICLNLNENCPDIKKSRIYKKFDEYKLSPREKEIGYRWLLNHSTLRMAEEFGIAEGTVRNVLKKIYRKTGVCDKGQFFREFLS